MKPRYLLASFLSLALFGCGGADDTAPPGTDDADGDTISDDDEGRADATDTDHDGTPDWQDDDADGDGIPDYREAGDDLAGTNPIDSDGDGTPDFRDLDSDGNGRADNVDGTGDLDGDGRGDYADLDDDGDNIPDGAELGPDPASPLDTDSDGVPDFNDTDSDGDTILDEIEGVEDYDEDAIGNWRDLDSDGDCRGDQVESGGTNPPRDTDLDQRFDFLDRDSDNDGLTDQAEDTNCNGSWEGDESNATNPDSDFDGVSDLIEVAAGTDPNDNMDNPQANGDFVFIEPYQEAPSPLDDDLDFQTRLQNVDVYVVVDRSGSMSTETNSIKNSLGNIIRGLQCAPVGTGTPPSCLNNLYAGLGAVGYINQDPFRHYLDIQVNPNFAGQNIPGVSTAPSQEPLTFGTWASITGLGSAGSGCSVAAVAPRAGCPNGTFGYPCFRPGALPVVALVTDEPPLGPGDTYVCPNRATTANAMNAKGAKLMGIYGSGSNNDTLTGLRNMAIDTGAVDAGMNNAPLVFNGADANAAMAIADGIRTLANGVPLDMKAAPVDDPADTVDAVAAFVHHLETLQLGTPMCTNGLTDRDTNADTFDDEYVDVRASTPVCWKVVVKQNTTVPATQEPQLFRANVVVTGDGITELDRRDVFFLVPPVPADEPIN